MIRRGRRPHPTSKDAAAVVRNDRYRASVTVTSPRVAFE